MQIFFGVVLIAVTLQFASERITERERGRESKGRRLVSGMGTWVGAEHALDQFSHHLRCPNFLRQRVNSAAATAEWSHLKGKATASVGVWRSVSYKIKAKL